MVTGVRREIPFLDLKCQYLEIQDDVRSAISRVFDGGWFILGENVVRFEEEFAAYLGAKYGIGVASGTDALRLSLEACGVGSGDEVLTAPNTALATVAAVSGSGATPVFIDIDPDTYTIDVSKIEAKITGRTKAIIPVHLYGQMAEMEFILDVAAAYGLWVVEDACQAHGASLGNKKAGTHGHLGCFSFYPSKNLGGYGDGGMVVTDNFLLAERVRLLRNYGETKRYHHVIKGYNSRMDELQAAILRVKLGRLDEYNRLRRERAADYNRLLAGVGDLILPQEKNGSHVYHLYVIRTAYRDQLQRYLAEHQVRTQIHYPVPVHLQEAYREMGLKKGGFPLAEEASKQILSLPLYPEIEVMDVELVAGLIKEYFGEIEA